MPLTNEPIVLTKKERQQMTDAAVGRAVFFLVIALIIIAQLT